jgi:hypothetical protein
MPRKPPTEAYVDVPFPVNGVDQSAGYQDQRPLTTRTGQNVRAFEPGTGRARGGSRPGLRQYVPQQLPSGAHLVQNLATVVSVSSTALPWIFNYPYLTFPDPSSPGLPGDWGPGKFSRVPPLLLPQGGWLYPPNKNLPKPVKIVWGRPADIAFGTALGGTQLNASARDAITNQPIAGSFSYSPASGVLLPVGQQEPLAATFTAADAATYQSGIKAANLINVLTAMPSHIQLVQSVATDNGTTGSYGQPVVQGNLLLVAVLHRSAGANTVTVSDSLGNAYLQAGSYSAMPGDTNVTASLWYCLSQFSGGNTVTVAGDFVQVPKYVTEWSGVSAIQTLDNVQVGGADQSGSSGEATLTLPPVGLAQAGEMVFAFFAVPDNPSTPEDWMAGSGMTLLPLLPASVASYVIGPLPGTLAPTVTAFLNANSRWVGIAASFKPA